MDQELPSLNNLSAAERAAYLNRFPANAKSKVPSKEKVTIQNRTPWIIYGLCAVAVTAILFRSTRAR